MAHYDLNLRERLILQDNQKKNIFINRIELLYLKDNTIIDKRFSISDLRILDKPSNQVDFEEEFLNAPIGYDRFGVYQDGEYTLREAYFKTVFKSLDPFHKPSIIKRTVEADVEDVSDRGRITVPIEGTQVLFGEVFIEPPEVFVTAIISGTDLLFPKIEDITNEGFFIELVAANDPEQNRQGIVSWLATGY